VSTKTKSVRKKAGTKTAQIRVSKKLDSVADTSFFEKKMARANELLQKAGLPGQ
jgi:hypothetical protein